MFFYSFPIYAWNGDDYAQFFKDIDKLCKSHDGHGWQDSTLTNSNNQVKKALLKAYGDWV